MQYHESLRKILSIITNISPGNYIEHIIT